jgi:hypothetical protein
MAIAATLIACLFIHLTRTDSNAVLRR